ncbi:hypothetical protein RIR_jg8948.t1 [Rhizophagus irregularis DAOM 181602=DAOM 197198]|nr:hypothetical protein RIR_jg8948.t1 [Rhizophagus irregularis DAOM 181602=DAOM 197198]
MSHRFSFVFYHNSNQFILLQMFCSSGIFHMKMELLKSRLFPTYRLLNTASMDDGNDKFSGLMTKLNKWRKELKIGFLLVTKKGGSCDEAEHQDDKTTAL